MRALSLAYVSRAAERESAGRPRMVRYRFVSLTQKVKSASTSAGSVFDGLVLLPPKGDVVDFGHPLASARMAMKHRTRCLTAPMLLPNDMERSRSKFVGLPFLE